MKNFKIFYKKMFTFIANMYKIIKGKNITKENIKRGENKPMKILMLTWEYPPRIVGGIARVVHDLSKRLIKDGHDVTVVTYRDGDTPYYENDKGVEVYRVDNYMIRPNNFIDWIMQLNFNMVAKASEIIAKTRKI